MAKMFYTLDEAKGALAKNEEEIKQLSREGRLREFRDGARLMFKADQVEALKAELAGGTGQADLGPSDSGSAMAIGLTDSQGMSGTGLTLTDDTGRGTGAGITLKEDTALSADLGLSGSVGGVPSPARSGTGSALGLAGSATGSVAGSAVSGTGQPVSGSRAGVDVFQNEEVDRVDPGAATAVAGGVSDQMNVESVGSGSGLLDLTKESDDTSLGAELLDEIAPSASASGSGMKKTGTDTASVGSMAGLSGTRAGTGVGMAAAGARSAAAAAAPAPQVLVEKADPLAAAFGAAALGATVFVIFGAFALITGMLDTAPSIMQTAGKYGFGVLAGAGVVLSVVFFLIGLVLGKAGLR